MSSELENTSIDVMQISECELVRKKKRKKIKVKLINISTEISDEDIPLALIKRTKQGNSKNKTEIKISKTRINKDNKKTMKPKKKVYQYKNRKKIFCQSDSESTDFEKYTYFDESKTKRKIKLCPKLKMDELERQIREIKVENMCLAEEHKRVNEIKLKERLKLRMEIGRLKTLITELKICGFFNNGQMPEVGNTATLIETLNAYINGDNLSKIDLVNNETIRERIKSLKLTSSNFWQDFNSIERSSEGISSTPLWIGKLDNIHPNCDTYYKPNFCISVKNDPEIEQYPKSTFKHNGKNTADYHSDDCTSDVSSEGFTYNGDWNELATKRRIKKLELQNSLGGEVKEEIDLNSDLQNGEHCNASENDTSFDTSDLDVTNVSDDDPKCVRDASILLESAICIECGLDTSWPSFIARHREAYKSGIKLTPCNTCNMKFLNSGHFDGRHRLKRPPAKKVRPQCHICDVCGQGCTTRSGLSQHRLRHAEAGYFCPHCPYKCRRKGYIKKHIETHVRRTNTKPTKVDSQHPESLGEVPKSDTYKEKESYRCEHCNYTSSSKSYLNLHVKYHSAEKPFKCDQCPYQCIASSRMTAHKKTHANKVPAYNYYERCEAEYGAKTDNCIVRINGSLPQPNYV